MFGEDEAAGGFPEEQISSYEAATGIKLPVALREYCLADDRASLNYEEDFMFVPDREAKSFDSNVACSYDYIRGDLEWLRKKERPAVSSWSSCVLCLWNSGTR